MSTLLVTIGAGFIGSNIVEELLKRGETVRVIDNFSTGRRDHYPADESDSRPALKEARWVRRYRNSPSGSERA